MEKEKKPIYKKWWFWVIIVLVVVIIGSSSDDTNTPQTTLTAGNSVSDSSNISNNDSDKDKIYKVGEIYQNNNIAIKYVSLNDNFTNYSQYAEVKKGYKIIKAEFEAENLGTTDEYFSSYDFNCYADGYDCEDFWSVDDSTFGSTLSKGRKTKGAVYYMVPKDSKEIILEYDVNAFTGEKVKFKVK